MPVGETAHLKWALRARYSRRQHRFRCLIGGGHRVPQDVTTIAIGTTEGNRGRPVARRRHDRGRGIRTPRWCHWCRPRRLGSGPYAIGRTDLHDIAVPIDEIADSGRGQNHSTADVGATLREGRVVKIERGHREVREARPIRRRLCPANLQRLIGRRHDHGCWGTRESGRYWVSEIGLGDVARSGCIGRRDAHFIAITVGQSRHENRTSQTGCRHIGVGRIEIVSHHGVAGDRRAIRRRCPEGNEDRRVPRRGLLNRRLARHTEGDHRVGGGDRDAGSIGVRRGDSEDIAISIVQPAHDDRAHCVGCRLPTTCRVGQIDGLDEI